MIDYSRQEYLIYELPVVSCVPTEGWEERTVHELTKVIGGGTPDTSVPAFWGGEIPWATPTDITKREGVFISETERKLSPEGLKNSSATLLPVNSVLLTSRATIGECRVNTVPMATNQGFASLVPRDDVDPFFLYYLAHHLRPALCRLAAGTTYTEVSRREVRKIQCLVPKRKEEQREIAATLLAADEAIMRARAELEATRRLKTALLQQLFTRGISELHKQFRMTNIGLIPDKWEIQRIQDSLAEPPFSGVSPPSRPDPPGTPILNVGCIKDGICDPTDVTYVDVDGQTFEACRARRGDFYVLRGNGNREYVATGGLLMVEPNPACIFSDKLIRLRFNPDIVFDRFVPLMWQSHWFLRRLQSKAESGSGLWMISKRDIRREFFARPERDEQEQIVEMISSVDNTITSLCRKLEALLQVKRSLLQSLLTGKVRVDTGTVK